MSGLDFYGNLLQGGARLEAFRRGIAAVVRPGDEVLEVGTGLGTFAFFAAEAGAASVWGVDAHPVVHVAESLAAANGLSDVVRFARGSVPGVELPEAVDVLIFEDFPVRFLDAATHRLLDGLLRERLRPGGRVVPGAARLFLAPVSSDALRAAVFPFEGLEEPRHGIDWRVLRPLLANAPRKASLGEADLVGVGVGGPVLPLRPLPRAGELRLEGAWDADREGRIDALAIWFDLEVAPGVWVSNRPHDDPEPWGQWILPLDPPLPVAEGARVEAEVEVEELEDGAPGWMGWRVRAGGERRRGHEFAGLPIGSPELESLSPGGSGR